MKTNISIKRAYDEAAETDGCRILVDRLWPRGVSKEKASVGLWLKDVAPSPKLRTWFGHKPERFPEFKKKYLDELKLGSEDLDELEQRVKKEKVSLIYGAKDPVHNHAIVLLEFLRKR